MLEIANFIFEVFLKEPPQLYSIVSAPLVSLPLLVLIPVLHLHLLLPPVRV